MKLFKFSGGIHPPEKKHSADSAIEIAPLFNEYLVPLSQHIGAPAKAIVKVGDIVLKGQLIAESGGFVSTNIHSPTSGKVKKITDALNVNGSKVPAILIEADGEDKADETLLPLNIDNSDIETLRKRILDAGIVGMGGAAFPTQIKLAPPENKPIDTLIINAVECEPVITGDYRLIIEKVKDLINGIKILEKILTPKQIFIGIENNKPEAVKVLKKEVENSNIKVAVLPTIYPQGAEKKLIYTCTKREVPSGGLPMDVGCVVINIATTVAISDAVSLGKPLYERVVTVSGTPVVKPSNWLVRIGTSYKDVLKLAQGIEGDVGKVISGGPIMGFSVYSLDIPITKASGCILLLSQKEVSQFDLQPCLRCSHCNAVCPMNIHPSIFTILAENQRYEDAQKANIMDCMECGCCTYVCTAQRPILQQIRQTKKEIIALKQKN